MSNNSVNAQLALNYLNAGTDEPDVIPTDGIPGTLYLKVGDAPQVYQKQDNGKTTNWNRIGNDAFTNYILNPLSWSLYNNSGRTTPASVPVFDLTYTAVAPADAGNGINVDYIFHPTQPSTTPLVTVLSPTHITVAWYNGPTLANNPTAAQIKAQWDLNAGAVAIASCDITGVASNLQYITGSHLLINGGDSAPASGQGGIPTNIAINVLGSTSDLVKDAVSAYGQGASIDFFIDEQDQGNLLNIIFSYNGSAGMVLGANSDVRAFIYDRINHNLIPIVPSQVLPGPNGSTNSFVGQFTASPTSRDYRLIFHVSTPNATAWDLTLTNISIVDVYNPLLTQGVSAIVVKGQPISALVTDHMCVMWLDGATQWVPATITGAVIGAYGVKTSLGFATNIKGSVADIYTAGYLDGFPNFDGFVGYAQYIDNVAGAISPLPSPFNSKYVSVGMAVGQYALNIDFDAHLDEISNASGIPLKGGLLSNNGVNDGTGDQVLTVGANGNVLVANSAAALGLNWAAAIVNGGGFTYTVSTRTLAVALTGDVTGSATATAISAPTVTGKLLTGYVSGAGTIAATDSILQAIQKLNGNDGLKANIASPSFTGDVNSSTGNVLISTIGKGLQVKTGANAEIGTVALVAGSATVANTSVTANSRIFVCSNTDGGTPGWLRVSAKVVGTSFTITSSSGTDTSTVAWMIVESIP